MAAVGTAVACCAPLGARLLDAEAAVATAELFKALADPARVRIVNVLATTDEPVCVCELIEPLGLAAADGLAPSEEARRRRVCSSASSGASGPISR